MAAGESAGIILRIKADSADAQAKIKAFKSELKELEKATKDQLNPLENLAARSGLSAAQFDSLKVGALAAVGAIGAVVGVAVGASVALFKLASSASEYGSEIFDASQKTGLGAVAISSLKVAADQSGASLEAVTGGIERFAKTVGAAGDGSEKAAKQLKDLGIIPQEALEDLDGALETVFKRIFDAEPGIEQITLAQKAFGKSGADLIPVIMATGGSLEDFKKRCEELGITIDDEAARASDEFGDTLDTLSAQAAGIGRQFALQFMPQITDAMQAVSDAMSENQDIAREWGVVVGDVFYTVRMSVAGAMDIAVSEVAGFSNAIKFLSNDLLDLKGVLNILSLGSFSGLVENIEKYRAGVTARSKPSVGSVEQKAVTDAMSAAARAEARSLGTGGLDDDDGGAAKKAADDRDRRIREAEQLAKRNLRAGIAGAANNLGQGRDDIATSLDAMIAKLREFGTSDKVVDKIAKEFDQLAANTEIYLKALEKLENQERDTNTEAENSLLTQEQRMRRDKEEAALEKAREEFKKSVADLDKERVEKADKAIDREIDKTKELMRLEEEREANKDATLGLPRPVMPLDDVVGNAGAFDQLFAEFEGNTAATAGIEAMATAFQGLAQAVGAVVQAWVLYGSAGQSVRQVTAQILASVAQQAAVKAIFELAEGFAALAMSFLGIPNAGPSAAMHFKAAAMYGIIAGVAAAAGRGVAGNSFKKEAGGGGGGAGGDGAGQGNAPGLNFTERFAGFQNAQNQQMAQMQDRTNAVLGGVIDAVTKFNNKFGVTTPDAVVMAGAGGATEAVFNAVQDHMTTDMRGSTNLDRVGGKYR